MKQTKIAEHNFHENGQKNNPGLAMTHEQANDTVMEGTIDGEIDDVNGKDVPLKREKK